MAIIELHELTKYYGKTRGIENVDLKVEEGEIFGFIGPNGAGKSTTIRTMLGLIFPTCGSIKIFGEDALVRGAELRKRIGYLPSEVFYYDKMRVLDLLNYSASFYDHNCSERLLELADLMELDLKRRIEDLSYGNKKKVGIVQGLLHSPDLIMLDEPTSGLDPLMQQKFFDIIQAENMKGSTVFFSSHILSEVQELCNRVAIIRDGSIIKVEDIKTLRNDHYKKIRIKGNDLDSSSFNAEGVINMECRDNELSFFFKGDMNRLIHMISAQKIQDVHIEEPTLEEIFIHYYEREKS